MSDMGIAAQFGDAARVPVWTRPQARRFTPVPVGAPRGFSAWSDGAAGQDDMAAAEAPTIAEAEALIAEGYAQGLADGRHAAEAEMVAERTALARLAGTLEGLQPEPPAALAAVLAMTVRRLVAQIVGEVAIDDAMLAERTQAVAALVAEDATPSRLRLTPADAARLDGARLDVEVVPDPTLAPGSVLLETGAGWVEDGPAVRLDKLRAALDRMGAPR